MSLSKNNLDEFLWKSNLSEETERIFEILKNELLFSERNNSYEKMISKIGNFDRLIFQMIITHVSIIFLFNTGFLIASFWNLANFVSHHKTPLSQEVAASNFLTAIFPLVFFGFIPILLFTGLVVFILSEQRNSENILLNIKKRMDYHLSDENFKMIARKSHINSDKIDYFKIIEVLVLDSLKSHFEYLLKKEEKFKDRANAIIPIIAAMAVLILYYINGIPKEIINVFNRPSQYESIAILTGLLITFYVAINQFSYSRLSIKYLKCISTIEKLKSLNYLNGSSDRAF
jgi:hypothetical protein